MFKDRKILPQEYNFHKIISKQCSSDMSLITHRDGIPGPWKGQGMRVSAWEQTYPMLNACKQIKDLQVTKEFLNKI